MTPLLVESIVESPLRIEKISFANQRPLVFTELKKRTKEYFAQRGIESTGDRRLVLKASFFVLSYLFGYSALLFIPLPGWIALVICAYLGLTAAAIGFNLMHDGSHGSFSDKQWINTFAAYSINFLGGDALLWKNKHNIIHHTFTNIEGHDQDIAMMPILRSNVLQKKYSFHKFQHIYCFLVYGLSSILWVFMLDYLKYFSGKVGNIKIAGMSFKDHFIFWLTKISYVGFYLVLPSLVWGWGYTILGFLVYHFMLGTTLSIVFQLAHVVENTEFTDKHFENSKIDEEWAIHQLKTTSNFATGNKFVTWFTGGLNFQVEHHLFPKISHVHYPALNKIVKQVCAEMNVRYNEFSTFEEAVRSHVRYLKSTGKAF
ncbi:MAG TPA: acyl-CoA desaturase [Cytophagaceae bacterium]|jgi:linoleoyl-CoA desaturase|nr:acyl-CoA desaturase [Cytophagaceae bacterium]